VAWLVVDDYTSVVRWRWRLESPPGTTVASGEAVLDDSVAEYRGWLALPEYVEARSDWRDPASELALVHSVGVWLRHGTGGLSEALSTVTDQQLTVVVPAAGLRLIGCALPALALPDGVPLWSRAAITFSAGPPKPTGTTPLRGLRVLGVFSHPADGSPLSLRHERRTLDQLFTRLTVTGEVAELHALEYAVSKHELATVLADRRGWDVIHLSGHGSHQLLVLETGEGEPDPVTAGEVAHLVLEGAAHSGRRPGLVVISTCQSAAGAADRSLVSAGAGALAPSMAAVLSERLQAAVVGMRYPVSDRFARAWSARLYQLLGAGAALGVAAAQAARDAVPEMRVATDPLAPVVLGQPRFASREPAQVEHRRPATPPGLRAEPARFVGRSALMARAGRVLKGEAPERAVLLVALDGFGKSAMLAELAHRHHHRFAVVTDHTLAPGDPPPQSAGADAHLVLVDDLQHALDEQRGFADPAWARRWEQLLASGTATLACATTAVPACADHDPSVLVIPLPALGSADQEVLIGELPRLARLQREALRDPMAYEQLSEVRSHAAGHPGLLEAWERNDRKASEPRLRGQARRAFASLRAPVCRLLQVLAALRPADRNPAIVYAVWEMLLNWHGEDGPRGPALWALAVEAAHRGLLGRGDGDPLPLRLHPLAQAAIQSTGDPDGVAEVTRRAAAALWTSPAGADLARISAAEAAGRALPYLWALGRFEDAAIAIEAVGRADHSFATLTALRTYTELLAAGADAGPGWRLLLGQLLVDQQPEAALPILDEVARSGAGAAVQREAAMALALAHLHLGDLVAAQAEVARLPALTAQTDLGAWGRAVDKLTALQVESHGVRSLDFAMRAERLVADIERLEDDPRVPRDRWHDVLGLALDVARDAAEAEERWLAGLRLNRRIRELAQARGADPMRLASIRFHDYWPLMELHRLLEAERVLLEVVPILQANSVEAESRALGAFAHVAARLGDFADATRFDVQALRLKYEIGDPEPIARSHHNLATTLARAAAPPLQVLAHRLAAAVLRSAGGFAGLPLTLRALRRDLERYVSTPPPGTPGAVASIVGEKDGHALLALLATFSVEAAAPLGPLCARARCEPLDRRSPVERHALYHWAPVMVATAEAVKRGRGLERVEFGLAAHRPEAAEVRDRFNHLAARGPDRALLNDLSVVAHRVVELTLGLLDGTVEVDYVHGFHLLNPREEALAGSIAAAVRGDPDACDFLQALVEEDALGPDARVAVAAGLRGEAPAGPSELHALARLLIAEPIT